MRYRSPGKHKSAASFRAHLRELAPDLDCDLELAGAEGPLGRPFAFAGRELANRFAVHWRPDPSFRTQVNYLLQNPCQLEVERQEQLAD